MLPIALTFDRKLGILAFAGVLLFCVMVGEACAQMVQLPPLDASLPEAASVADCAAETHSLAAEVLPLAVQPGGDCEWTCQSFPDGLIYRSYLAGVKEPRFASVWINEQDQGPLWDITLGSRFGLFRYGTTDDVRPEGWQVDMEGAAFPRLDLDGDSTPLLAADFRFGVPVTYADGPFHVKLGYYHLSSHLGDEYLIDHPEVTRSNYSRDALIFGVGYYWTDNLRVYAESSWADWADSAGGVAEPWEFQFGVDYSPLDRACRGAPFAALNAHLREEADFGGNLVFQTGWQLPRGPSGAIFRLGFEYYNGKSSQASFFKQHEQKLGFGLWYDF